MANTSKPVSNIAVMGAELSVAIPIDREFFPTGRAGKSIVCFPPHQVQMGIPPLVAASVRAEAFSLPARILCDRFATLFTDSSRLWRCKAIPPAERLYCVDRNPKLGSYAAIPCSIPAQRNNLLFLFVIHSWYLLNFGLQSSGVTGQKAYR